PRGSTISPFDRTLSTSSSCKFRQVRCRRNRSPLRGSRIESPLATMLLALLSKGGKSHEREIASDLLARDESQIEYCNDPAPSVAANWESWSPNGRQDARPSDQWTMPAMWLAASRALTTAVWVGLWQC